MATEHINRNGLSDQNFDSTSSTSGDDDESQSEGEEKVHS